MMQHAQVTRRRRRYGLPEPVARLMAYLTFGGAK